MRLGLTGDPCLVLMRDGRITEVMTFESLAPETIEARIKQLAA